MVTLVISILGADCKKSGSHPSRSKLGYISDKGGGTLFVGRFELVGPSGFHDNVNIYSLESRIKLTHLPARDLGLSKKSRCIQHDTEIDMILHLLRKWARTGRHCNCNYDYKNLPKKSLILQYYETIFRDGY